MEDPELIATLIPTDKYNLAENAFRLKHNEDWYLPPTRIIQDGCILSSRDTTPVGEEASGDCSKYDFTHRIKLTFKTSQKTPPKGSVSVPTRRSALSY